MNKIAKLILSGLFLFIVLISYSQEHSKEIKNPDRKSKKEQKKLENKSFVVEFNKVVISGYGDAYNINPTINFIAVKGDSAIIQFETNKYLSMNGLGGLTFIGKFNNYKVSFPKKKSGSIRISFNVVTNWTLKGTLVSISIGDGTNATVRLGASLMFYGDFVKPEKTKAITGANFGF